MDTRNKRASAFGFALAALVILPAEDGTVAQADRQHVAFSYPGILSGALNLPDGDLVETTALFRRTLTTTAQFRRTVSMTVER